MTYRLDSDIPKPYGSVQSKHSNFTILATYDQTHHRIWNPSFDLRAFESSSLPHTLADLAHRPKKIAWVVSNCDTESKREHYVKKLQQYIDVDIYGGCGQECGPTREACFEMLRANYKFYISFENDFCNDYITEKTFARLPDRLLTIIRGPTQDTIDRHLPPHSYVNARHFTSPKHLAKFLHFLDQNSTAYLSYFWWHKHYRVIRHSPDSWCKLCENLHATTTPKVYHDFQAWWETDQCETVPGVPL